MDHKQILHDGLRRQRAALLQKLEGLSERDARLPRTPTGTNLLGLVKHAAVVELEYFGETFGRPAEVQLPWAAAGQPEEDNVDMFAAEGESLEDVLAFARRSFAHADATIEALDADAPGRVAWWPDDKTEVTLAQIMAHVALDEARHAGHADILREQIDGQAGLRAPGNNLPPWDADRWAAHVDRLTAIAEGSGGPGRN
ncbi:DinB family protein [Micrococcus luteus]|uniref:DinB family protein n=1 Tax=Micrococcus luteus TaxID=1270 RepID=UPI0038792E8E